jgi:hypothetical protein
MNAVPGRVLTPAPLMALSTGLWSFKTLAGALDLKIFTRLSGGRSATVQDMADELGFAHRPADLLMTACASLGLLERSGEGYRNTEHFLVQGGQYYAETLAIFREAMFSLDLHRPRTGRGLRLRRAAQAAGCRRRRRGLPDRALPAFPDAVGHRVRPAARLRDRRREALGIQPRAEGDLRAAQNLPEQAVSSVNEPARSYSSGSTSPQIRLQPERID